MVTFSAAHDYLARFESKPGDASFLQEFLVHLRQGKFILDGLPLDVMPAELFRRNDPQLTHVFWYRLLKANPMIFALAFSCFDEETLEVTDFLRLLGVVDCEIREHVEHDAQQPPIEPAVLMERNKGPIEGAVLLCHEDGDEEADIRVIIASTPTISEYASRVLLYHAVKQGLFCGFYG